MATLVQVLPSRNHWLADGATTVWNFSMQGGYILPEHVRAYYEDTSGVRTAIANAHLNLIGPFQMQVTPAVPAGVTFVIYRDSSNNGLPLVDFTDGARLTAEALDTVAQQGVFMAAESADFIGVTTSSQLLELAASASSSASSATAAAAVSTAAAASANVAASAATVSASSAASSAASAGSVALGYDTALRADFASTAGGKGDALFGHPLGAVPSAINTVEWAVKIVPEYAVSVLRSIPPAEWAGIFAGTSTYDASSDINGAIAANAATVLPAGAKFLCKTQIVAERGKELFGYGRSSQLLIDFTTTANFPGLVGVAIYTNSLPGSDNVNQAYGRTLQGFSVYGVNNAALTGNACTGMRFYANRSLSDGTYDFNDRDDAVYAAFIGTVQNVHVRRFDIGFDLAEVWHSKFISCVSGESRVPWRIKGKCVDVQFDNCDSTSLSNSYTPTATDTTAWTVQGDTYAGALTGSPEGIRIVGGMSVGNVMMGLEVANNPFSLHFRGHTFDCGKRIARIADSIQDFIFVHNNCTLRFDSQIGIEFLSTAVSAPSHSATIAENFFDCQTPTGSTSDGIVFPTTGTARNAIDILNNKFRNQWRYEVDAGGSAGNVGGIQYSKIVGNTAQQKTGGLVVLVRGNGQHSEIYGNTTSSSLKIVDAISLGAASSTCKIGHNKSPVQVTGGQWATFQTLALTAAEQTFDVFTFNRIDTSSAHDSVITADVQLRGNAVHSRRLVIRFTKTGIFAENAAIIATDANFTADQSNANYAVTFSFAVTNPTAGAMKLRLTARVTGALETGLGASYRCDTTLAYATGADLVNIV